MVVVAPIESPAVWAIGGGASRSAGWMAAA
jgi:hypothetical protein